MTATTNMKIKALDMLLDAMERSAESFECYQDADSEKSKKVWHRQFLNDEIIARAKREMICELFDINFDDLILRSDIRQMRDELMHDNPSNGNNVELRANLRKCFADLAENANEQERECADWPFTRAKWLGMKSAYENAKYAVMDDSQSLQDLQQKYKFHEWARWNEQAEYHQKLNNGEAMSRCIGRIQGYKRCAEIIENHLTA